MDYETLYDADIAGEIKRGFAKLKEVTSTREHLAALGEKALTGEDGPAAAMIAHHVATLSHLAGHSRDLTVAYRQAKDILHSGEMCDRMMAWIDKAS